MTPEGVRTLATAREGDEDLYLPVGLLRVSRPPPMRGSAWKRCATTAAHGWPAGTTPNRILWPECRIPAPLTPSAMPMSREFPSPVRLLNTRPPGRAPSCPPSRARRNLIAKMKLIPVHDLIQGKKPAAYRRFHCPRDADAGNHRVPVSERRQGGSYPSRLPASAVWMQISQFFPLLF